MKPLRKPGESEKRLQPVLFEKSAGWLGGVAQAEPSWTGIHFLFTLSPASHPSSPSAPAARLQPRGNKNMKEAVDCAAFSFTFCCNEIIAWMNKRGLYNYSK